MRDGPRLEAYSDNCRPNRMSTGPMDSKSCLFCLAHATPIRPNTDFSPLLFSKTFCHFQCYPLIILSLLLAPVHSSEVVNLVVSCTPSYSLLSVPHLARPLGSRDHASISNLLGRPTAFPKFTESSSRLAGGVRFRYTSPVWPETSRKPVKFKFKFKNCRAIGLDRLTGRFDW